VASRTRCYATMPIVLSEVIWGGKVMPEPREDDDIALGLDEEEVEDETYDTLDEKYGDD